jgi:hypothetical protein
LSIPISSVRFFGFSTLKAYLTGDLKNPAQFYSLILGFVQSGCRSSKKSERAYRYQKQSHPTKIDAFPWTGIQLHNRMTIYLIFLCKNACWERVLGLDIGECKHYMYISCTGYRIILWSRSLQPLRNPIYSQKYFQVWDPLYNCQYSMKKIVLM